jgi:hypothetical protein
MLTQTRQLETEKQKYQTLFETNSDAVVILDDRVLPIATATLSLFGMDSLDLPRGRHSQLGTPYRPTAWPPWNTPCSTLARRSQGHAVMDWQARRQDGSVSRRKSRCTRCSWKANR